MSWRVTETTRGSAGTASTPAPCNIAAMSKPPSKRGPSRGGTTPGKAGPSRPAPNKAAGKLPGWLPDPGLARAMGGGAAKATAPVSEAPAARARKSNAGAPGPRRSEARAPAASSGRGGDPHAAREAARYEQPIASREMILQVLTANDGPMDADALAQKLALTAPDRFDALSKRWLRAVSI